METYKFIKITNNKTGMSYITRTRKSLEYTKDRFKQQANSRNNYNNTPLLKQAILDYGFENFSWDIIKTCDCTDRESLDIVNMLIENNDTITPHGYNINASKGRSAKHKRDGGPKVRIKFAAGPVLSMTFRNLDAAINYLLYTGRLTQPVSYYVDGALDALNSDGDFVGCKWEYDFDEDCESQETNK